MTGRNGKPAGNIVEIRGLLGVEGEINRGGGAKEVLDKYPDVKIVGDPVADWIQAKAKDRMTEALRAHPKIDLVYGHNDPMAYGAYLAAKDAGREKEMKFLGVDGLPNEGVKWVHNGELTATFLYPTPGAEGVRQGLKLMKGEKVEKKIILPTMTIDKSNADEILKANGIT